MGFHPQVHLGLLLLSNLVQASVLVVHFASEIACDVLWVLRAAISVLSPYQFLIDLVVTSSIPCEDNALSVKLGTMLIPKKALSFANINITYRVSFNVVLVKT